MVLLPEELEKIKRAGKITAEALKLGEGMIKGGAVIFDIAEAVERKMVEMGGKPAFPANISINEVAAHYSPLVGDGIVVKETDYVKLDIGAHVDGFIADAAITVRPAGEDELILCAKKMLSVAIPMFTPGTQITDIGETIEGVAKEFGFKSIRNLTGHGIERYNLHAGVMIQNVKTNSAGVIDDGKVYACEPFCTNGAGMVKEVDPATIFRWIMDRPVRTVEARKIMELGKTDFARLPFAKRWLQKQFGSIKTELALKELSSIVSVYPYKILKETGNGMVTQFEHTIIVGEKPFVTTLL